MKWRRLNDAALRWRRERRGNERRQLVVRCGGAMRRLPLNRGVPKILVARR